MRTLIIRAPLSQLINPRNDMDPCINNSTTLPHTHKQYVTYLSRIFPEHKKETIQQVVDLLILMKTKPSSEYGRALDLILGRQNTSEFYDTFSHAIEDDVVVQRTAGRPRSKVTSVQYLKNELLRVATECSEHMLEIIESKDFDIASRSKDFRRVHFTKDNIQQLFYAHAKCEPYTDELMNLPENCKTCFSAASIWGATVMLNLVVPVMIRRAEKLWCMSAHIGEQLAASSANGEFLKNQVGFTDEMSERFVVSRNKKLPNELVKKVRKPKFARKKFIKFSRVVKLTHLPTPEMVAKEMDMTVKDIMLLHHESLKLNMGISLGKNGNETIFVIK
jgi:hypothetical protein